MLVAFCANWLLWWCRAHLSPTACYLKRSVPTFRVLVLQPRINYTLFVYKRAFPRLLSSNFTFNKSYTHSWNCRYWLYGFQFILKFSTLQYCAIVHSWFRGWSRIDDRPHSTHKIVWTSYSFFFIPVKSSYMAKASQFLFTFWYSFWPYGLLHRHLWAQLSFPMLRISLENIKLSELCLQYTHRFSSA